jgi:hypothetical protein
MSGGINGGLRYANPPYGLRLEGDVTELFDVGVVANVRCPRGLGAGAIGVEETVRGEETRGPER